MNNIIFANIVNQIMISAPPMDYADALARVTMRKIWLAREGDMLILPSPMPEEFLEYACNLLDINSSALKILTPSGASNEWLANRLMADTDCFNEVKLFTEKNSCQLVNFALDYPTCILAEKLGISPAYYNELPTPEVIEEIYNLNSKSGFRNNAKKLGMPVIEGRTCRSIYELKTNIMEMLTISEKIIIKIDRSSNGYKSLILSRNAASEGQLDYILYDWFKGFYYKPEQFTIEEYKDFISVPSIELEITDNDINILYLSDQLCPNGSFTGLVTPPQMTDAENIEKLTQYGFVFGEFLKSRGIRGVYDVDSGLTRDGKLYCTETNLRRTGGTYLDYLVKRLNRKNKTESHYWIADSKFINNGISFSEGLKLLKDNGLAYDKNKGMGIILTANTRSVDRKWRYLVISETNDQAEEYEKKFLHSLL